MAAGSALKRLDGAECGIKFQILRIAVTSIPKTPVFSKALLHEPSASVMILSITANKVPAPTINAAVNAAFNSLGAGRTGAIRAVYALNSAL